MTAIAEAAESVVERVRRWWTWRGVRVWRQPTRQTEAARCPFCGSELVAVTTPVPVYPSDPKPKEPKDGEDEAGLPEPKLDFHRCGGCRRFQVGERAA